VKKYIQNEHTRGSCTIFPDYSYYFVTL